MSGSDSFNAQAKLQTKAGDLTIHSLEALERSGLGATASLPYSLRVLLENVLRNVDGFSVLDEHVRILAQWNAADPGERDVPYKPARVLLQDFTGVPAVVDLAALRSAMQRLGGDPQRINPQIPADLVIDHSVQVDHFGSNEALSLNALLEFERNRERYELLRWGQNAFRDFRVVPPATGICHQVNLEYLAQVVIRREVAGRLTALPDTLVGTDSHTTMINGLGVLGWGVGGIEAEAALLGQPLYMLMPKVVGFRLTGRLPAGTTATDLVLRVTEVLRTHGVVGKFVEFFGPGLAQMSLPDRAVLANMAPEYGATMGFFPVDDQTLAYLKLTGRSAETLDLVERYCKEQGLFRTDDSPPPKYSETLELDLETIEPALAGPKRPQDRVPLARMKETFRAALRAPIAQRGFELDEVALQRTAELRTNGSSSTMTHGAVVIAAITSCTNTSSPSVMLAAGLAARKAVERGLRVKPWVKTSLAPGSRVVTDYLARAGLTPYLDQLGFQTVGYGCTTCIGNSGPLPENVATAVQTNDLVACSVLSGNRNFEGRINPLVKANYLASPPLVVAYALAGTTDINLDQEPLGLGADGKPVYLRDIWPTPQEVDDTVARCVTPELFTQRYADVFTGSPEWQAISAGHSAVYEWRADSTYVQEPPFFTDLTPEVPPIRPLSGARCLVMVGDSTTTDHISPAGAFSPDSPAGHYLQELGVRPAQFNSYGSRRGNDRVMTRGTFANVRLRNLLAPGSEGGVTIHFPSGARMSVYDAAMRYEDEGTPLIVIGGKDYGMGSSRDWAAKGTLLLGVRAVLAASFERIHRTNLVCMGVLPLQFPEGQTCATLGLTGREVFELPGLDARLQPLQDLAVEATHPETGKKTGFTARCRIDTPVEVEYYRNGGVLHSVLRCMLADDGR
ncbi:MAG: aconitate hydratase AcnA [Planctomycetes bacterium]|nr:aconitate hydratase AcnA [Planctomycetota bacterium]